MPCSALNSRMMSPSFWPYLVLATLQNLVCAPSHLPVLTQNHSYCHAASESDILSAVLICRVMCLMMTKDMMTPWMMEMMEQFTDCHISLFV